MARLIDFGGEVNSNLVQGLGTNSATFTMPGNIGLAVESVLATINNSAGGVATATLTVRDQSGEVIAKKRLGDTIPAADTGTATWALRLTDNDGGASVSGIQFDVVNVGDWLYIETTNALGIRVFADLGSILLAAANSALELLEAGGMNLTGTGPLGVTADSAGFTLNSNFAVASANGNASLQFPNGSVNSTMLNGRFDASSFFRIFTGDDCAFYSTNGPADHFAGSVGHSISPTEYTVQLVAGTTLTVRNHLGNPIFRVDEDGDLHGLTGKSLVFDL